MDKSDSVVMSPILLSLCMRQIATTVSFVFGLLAGYDSCLLLLAAIACYKQSNPHELVSLSLASEEATLAPKTTQESKVADLGSLSRFASTMKIKLYPLVTGRLF